MGAQQYGITTLIFIGWITASLDASAAQARTVIRVGHFPNITHAQGVIAHGLSRQKKGWFEERLGPDVQIQWFVYNAGPSAMEALLAKSIDLTYVGPNPAINAHLKARGEDVRIVAGACSGGAALVVDPAVIQKDADFKGKKVGTPQLGNTQDVAARAWLQSKNFRVTLTGGDVQVIPTSNPDQLLLFQRKDLQGVWTVEPWVTRLLQEAGAKLYMEESALWKDTGGKYVTTHLVSSAPFLKNKPDLVKKWIAAHVELTEWINKHTEEAKKIFNDEMKAETTRALPTQTLDPAWKRLELTYDPVKASLLKSAEDAHRIGFIKEKPNLSRIYELNVLNEVLKEKGLKALE